MDVHKPMKRYTPEEVETIRRMHKELYTVQEIAAALGRTYGTVHQKILQLGLVKRRDHYLVGRLSRQDDARDLVEQLKDPDKIRVELEQRAMNNRLSVASARREATAKRAQMVQEALAHADEMLAAGASRVSAFHYCRAAGATLEEVGRHFGLTRERVRQITEDTYTANRKQTIIGKAMLLDYEALVEVCADLLRLLKQREQEQVTDNEALGKGGSDTGSGTTDGAQEGPATDAGFTDQCLGGDGDRNHG